MTTGRSSRGSVAVRRDTAKGATLGRPACEHAEEEQCGGPARSESRAEQSHARWWFSGRMHVLMAVWRASVASGGIQCRMVGCQGESDAGSGCKLPALGQCERTWSDALWKKNKPFEQHQVLCLLDPTATPTGPGRGAKARH